MALAGSASAVTPWLIDWCHIVPYQHFLVRISYYNTQAGHDRTINQPRVQLFYGLTKCWDVGIREDLVEKSTADSDHQGVSDAILYSRYRFYKDAHDMEIGVGGTLTAPTAEADISGRAWCYNGYLMASRPFGKLTVYSQLGENVPDTDRLKNSTQYGVLFAYDLTPNLMLAAESFNATQTESGARQEHAWGAGAAYRTNPSTTFFARYGHSAEGFSAANITVGMQFVLGKPAPGKQDPFLLAHSKAR
jgi:hypothetical protein